MSYPKIIEEILSRHRNALADDLLAAYRAGIKAGRAEEAEQTEAVRDQLVSLVNRLAPKAAQTSLPFTSAPPQSTPREESITSTVKFAIGEMPSWPNDLTPEAITKFCNEQLGKSLHIEQVRPVLKSLVSQKVLVRVARGVYRAVVAAGSTTDVSSSQQPSTKGG